MSVSGAHEVRVFDTDGRYVRTFGGEGEGPGEFHSFSTMLLFPVDSGSIAVTDRFNGRIQVFAAEGAPREIVELGPCRSAAPRGPFADGSGLLVQPLQSGGDPDGLRVLQIGTDFLVGVRRDALDVETIEVYQLDRPR